jgi:NAD dependent epimerase/dehydratase family enzyme
MKEWTNQLYPNLRDIGDSQEALDELTKVIVKAWEAISQDTIDHLIRSIDYRVNAVLAAEGWHIKY